MAPTKPSFDTSIRLVDRKKLVVLAHLSENILRNLNRYRQLLWPGNGLSFKPRYVVDHPRQTLKLLPMIELNPGDYRSFSYHPDKFLTNEYFLPGTKSGMFYLRFPYFFSLLRSLSHPNIKAVLGGYPWYKEFYQQDHPTKGTDLTAMILEAFVREARNRNQIPLLIIFPTQMDLRYRQETGMWVYQSLLSRLSNSNLDINVVNIGENIIHKLNGRDHCQLFNNCSGHLNEKGNQLVADIIYNEVLPYLDSKQ